MGRVSLWNPCRVHSLEMRKPGVAAPLARLAAPCPGLWNGSPSGNEFEAAPANRGNFFIGHGFLGIAEQFRHGRLRADSLRGVAEFGGIPRRIGVYEYV